MSNSLLFSLTAGEIVECKRSGFRQGDVVINIIHSTNYGSFAAVLSGTPGVNETATATLISAAGTGCSGTAGAVSLNLYYAADKKLYLQNGTAGTLSNIAVKLESITGKKAL
jgi:hypothetical protein